jgi:hypothetical protein
MPFMAVSVIMVIVWRSRPRDQQISGGRCDSDPRYRPRGLFASNGRQGCRVLKEKLRHEEEVRRCPLADEMPMANKERTESCARL